MIDTRDYISIYDGVKDAKSTNMIQIISIIDDIGNEKYKDEIQEIQAITDKKKRNAAKQKLEAVTWSGQFEPRVITGLYRHSGLICIDIDDLTEWGELHNALELDPFLFAKFISPSGNGLKLIFAIDVTTEKINERTSYEADRKNIIEAHYEYFNCIAAYLKSHYGIIADESGKDPSRLCFVSSDDNLYNNAFCTVIDINTARKWIKKAPEPKAQKQTVPKPEASISVNDQLDHLRTFTDKIKAYVPGKRNHYINTFAYNCKQHGINESDCIDYSSYEFTDYEDGIDDVIKIVKSVYANAEIGFGIKNFPKKGSSKTRANTQNKISTAADQSQSKNEYDEQILFWYEVEKADKDTGEVKIEHKFDHDGMTYFLANNGFRKMKLGERGYQFVNKNLALIEAIEPEDINHYIMSYLHKDVHASKDGTFSMADIQDELHEVRKMYKRGLNSYTKIAMYTSLPELIPNFLKDTEKTTYLYFKNGYVEITDEAKKLITYESLTSNIWTKQQKQATLTLLPFEEVKKSDIYNFLEKAIIGKPSDDGKDEKRFQSMLTTIGYLLDTYKDPTLTIAPIFQDKKPNLAGNEANGGSGKTLTAHMIGKMINSCLIDGKTFRFDAPYPYDTFKIDHKLIVYNDVTKKFPFEQLFHKITEDFTFDKRYVDAIVIPHEEAPKHLVITNYSLSGDGSSFARRQHIIEFCDYFNDLHTPKDEFKHRFFIDWDETEWNRYYNFMIMCVQLFKKHGLIKFPATNVKMNKLLNEAGEEFIDWMDEMFIGDKDKTAIRPLGRNSKDELFESLKENVRRYSMLQNSNKFTGWVKTWADMRNFTFQIDKSGRNYYWTFIPKEGTEGLEAFRKINATTEEKPNIINPKDGLPF